MMIEVKSQMLKDWLPKNFIEENPGTRIVKYANVKIKKVYGLADSLKAWPGRQKNVIEWVLLENGWAIGYKDVPTKRGWSFYSKKFD